MEKLVKYSLPRHTLLAKQSTRIGAAFVDLAIGLVFFMIFFFGCTNIIASQCFNNSYNSTLNSWEVYSHLVYYDKETNQTKIYESTEDYTVYEVPVQYYYLNYLTGQNIEIPEGGDPSHPELYCSQEFDKEMTIDEQKVLPKDYYTMSWFNKNVLDINSDDPDAKTSSTYFTFQKDSEGHYIKDVLGVPKVTRYDVDKGQEVEITKTDLAAFFKVKYQDAYSHYSSLSFVYSLKSKVNFINTIAFIVAIIIAGAINYIVIPLFMKNGATLGKKLFKLGLADIEGYAIEKRQLPLRFIPFLLTCIGVAFIPTATLYFSFIVVSVIFLSSFGISMASPKKCSLHDYLARTIVIDVKGSIIFKNPIEEEEYLKNEDDIDQEIVMGGEEPELKYEK